MKYLDISGPKGNAFYILSLVPSLARDLQLDKDIIQAEMQNGDYANLLRLFQLYFGRHITLCSPHKIPGLSTKLYEIKYDEYI